MCVCVCVCVCVGGGGTATQLHSAKLWGSLCLLHFVPWAILGFDCSGNEVVDFLRCYQAWIGSYWRFGTTCPFHLQGWSPPGINGLLDRCAWDWYSTLNRQKLKTYQFWVTSQKSEELFSYILTCFGFNRNKYSFFFKPEGEVLLGRPVRAWKRNGKDTQQLQDVKGEGQWLI